MSQFGRQCSSIGVPNLQIGARNHNFYVLLEEEIPALKTASFIQTQLVQYCTIWPNANIPQLEYPQPQFCQELIYLPSRLPSSSTLENTIFGVQADINDDFCQGIVPEPTTGSTSNRGYPSVLFLLHSCFLLPFFRSSWPARCLVLTGGGGVVESQAEKNVRFGELSDDQMSQIDIERSCSA